MKKVKQVTFVALLSLFIFSASIVKAQHSKTNGMQKPQGIENSIPDLTDKQKEKIKTLKTAHLKKTQQLKNQMDIKRADLKALQTAENPNLDAINKKIEEKSALRTELQKETAAYKQSVRALLTEDQKVVYDQKTMHRSKAHNCGHKPGKQCGSKNKPCKK